jgi:2-polyprenyl-3-methyl-5-hydroxy-6-metoxy-1,4-benzoquinol methylase
MSEKEFIKYTERGDCHWQEEFGSFRKFNLIQHSRFLSCIKEVPMSCEKILDWGCGDGALSKHIIPRSKEFVGVDTEMKGLEFFRKNIPVDDKQVRLIHIPYEQAYHINEADKTFDCIVCSDVIEHVSYPEKLVSEFRRLCTPNGKVIISTPYKITEEPNDPMHVHEFYPNELRNLLLEQFEDVEIKLYQKIAFASLYNLQFHYLRIGRFIFNLLFNVFGYNPFMKDQATKTKWDCFTLITAIASKPRQAANKSTEN